MESGYYPTGTEFDPKAPWNQPSDQEPIEIKVAISVTLSKTVTVLVDNYEVECDNHDRVADYNFSNCDLKQAVKDQVTLPQNLAEVIEDMFKEKLKAVRIPRHLQDCIDDCKDWCVEDFECTLD